jgi:hypothetical protein
MDTERCRAFMNATFCSYRRPADRVLDRWHPRTARSAVDRSAADPERRCESEHDVLTTVTESAASRTHALIQSSGSVRTVRRLPLF